MQARHSWYVGREHLASHRATRLSQVHVAQVYPMLDGDAAAGDDAARDLNWFLKMVAAPLGLMQAVTFQAQALQRLPAGQGPLSKLEDGTREHIMQRIANQGFEQTLMTLVTALSLGQVGTIAGLYNGYQLAVACVYMYLIGRPLFALGYLTNENNRLPGLWIGGFWLNTGYLLFCAFVLIGCDPALGALWYGCVCGCPLLSTILVFFLLPGPAASLDSSETEAINP